MNRRIYYQYKDKRDNRIISNENIIADDKNGIIEHINGTSFRFIPKKNLEKEPIAADYGYDKEKAPEIAQKTDTSSYNKTNVLGTPKILGDYYDYAFGINKIDLKETKAKKVSGFISRELEINNVDYIEISSDVSSKNCSIEYSIIDGIKEIPILPIEDTIVFREKLFYGLDTRFLPNLNKNITIYKNGEVTNLTYEDIKSINFNDGEYSITYYPIKDSHKHMPTNKTIKVKIIERCLKKQIPAIVKSVVILKYGDKNTWNI